MIQQSEHSDSSARLYSCYDTDIHPFAQSLYSLLLLLKQGRQFCANSAAIFPLN